MLRMAVLDLRSLWTSPTLLMLITSGLCQQFAVEPGNVTVTSGYDVALICSIKNLGGGQVDWFGPPNDKQYTLGTQVAPGLVGISLTGNHAAGEYNLQIANAQRASNAGTYTCSVGFTLSSSAVLTINDPATNISTQLENTGDTALDSGTNTNLTCSVYKTFPQADITWLEETQAGNKANTSLSQTTSEQSFTDSGLTYYNTTSTLTVIWRSSPSQVSYWCHVQPGNISKKLSITFNSPSTTTTPASPDSALLPWWGWLLIGIGVLALLIIVIWFVLRKCKEN